MTAPPDPRQPGGHAPSRRLLFWLLASAVAASVPAAAQPAGVPPVPARRHETIPPRPDSTRYIWQPGHWNWDAAGERYAWYSGRYVVRGIGVRRFIVGRWVVVGETWQWRRARWR